MQCRIFKLLYGNLKVESQGHPISISRQKIILVKYIASDDIDGTTLSPSDVFLQSMFLNDARDQSTSINVEDPL